MKSSATLERILQEGGIDKTFWGYGRFDSRIFDQEDLNKYDCITKWENDASEKLSKLDSYLTNEYKIPPLEHMVYFTSDKEPKELKDLYIKKIIATATRLQQEDPNFEPIIWTNNIEIENLESVKEIKKELPNLKIKSVKEEFSNDPLYGHLIEFIKKGQNDYRFFVEASDIARILVQYKYGGYYHDLDGEVFDAKKIVQFMKSFDFFNGKEEAGRWDSFTGNAVIASKKLHPILKEAKKNDKKKSG